MPFLAAPEKSNAYELGLKTSLLDKTLILDADVFLDDIKNYQQAVQVYDAYTTTLRADSTTYYTAATGNAAKVRATGFEFDSVYTPLSTVSLRLSGAYNNAVYKNFTNSAQPLENANLTTPYRNVTGANLPGAAKFTRQPGRRLPSACLQRCLVSHQPELRIHVALQLRPDPLELCVGTGLRHRRLLDRTGPRRQQVRCQHPGEEPVE